MSHTYSESPGRALSHGATQFMSYICKKMSKSRFRDPSEQGFLRFSELGSPDYIVETAIFSVWVFLMISVHGNTLYAIAIHKNMFITPFLTLWSHFENQTKNLLSILQLLRTCHTLICPALSLQPRKDWKPNWAKPMCAAACFQRLELENAPIIGL